LELEETPGQSYFGACWQCLQWNVYCLLVA